MWCPVWLNLTLNGLLDSRRASWGREIWAWRFFPASLHWKKAFADHDLGIAIPILTVFLCEAFKLVLEIWPNVSGKIFLSPWCLQLTVWRPRCASQQAVLHFVVISLHSQWGSDTAIHRAIYSLFIPYGLRSCSPWLGGKRCIFPETSHGISGCCWAGWQSLSLLVLWKPSSECRPFNQ
jgi:hypothetical protein